MPRPRIVEPGVPHHSVLRGNNRRRLFSYPADYRAFVAYLEIATREHGVALHNYCLMQNHIHLISTPDSKNEMSSWVKSFSQRFAQRRNRGRGSTGKLFEERFRCFPICNERYLAACTAYVELNPVRAGKVKRAEDYRWSTTRLLVADHRPSILDLTAWTPSPYHLGLGRTNAERGAAFIAALDAFQGGPPPELPSEHLAAVKAAEDLSAGYGLRLRRPDGTRAA